MARGAGRSRLRANKGKIAALYARPPAGSVVIRLDEWGPESAKSFPGRGAVAGGARPAQRATQEIDHGRRGKGYVRGAFRPATGDAYTHDSPGRTIANWVDCLERADAWPPSAAERGYAILANPNAHHADDALLSCLAHPRWEFVFRPAYAAYLNLIEPRRKALRSLAFKGRRCETWEEMAAAVRAATAYWDAHKPPFVWGRRRRHRAARRPGIGLIPKVA